MIDSNSARVCFEATFGNISLMILFVNEHSIPEVYLCAALRMHCRAGTSILVVASGPTLSTEQRKLVEWFNAQQREQLWIASLPKM